MTAETALCFWNHVFSDQRGLLQVFTAERVGGELVEPKSRFFNYPAKAENGLEWALQESERGREVYFCAHLLTARQRIKDNAAAVKALWADLDGAELPNGTLKPSVTVESSPGQYHAYWSLTDAIPPQVAEDLNKRLTHEIGADPSGFDLTQLLRVPGTVNHKYSEQHTVEVVRISDAVYSPADLDECLPRFAASSDGHRTDDGEDPPVILGPEALKVWRGERSKANPDGTVDRSASLLWIGRVLFEAGATRNTIVAALRERDVSLGWGKYADRADADRQYGAICDELESQGRNGHRTSDDATGAVKTGKPATPTHDELRDRWSADNPGHAHGLGEWRRYADGIWPVVSETSVKAGIGGVIEEAKPEGIKPTASILASVTELTRINAYVPDEKWDADTDILVCKNGAVRISSGELLEHAPEHYATSAVPFDFNPNAVPVVWDYFLDHTVPDEADFLQEFAGYALTTDTAHELAVWLHGPRGSGKSSFVAGLQAMLGPRAGVLGLADLERSRFTLAGLVGKTLVVAREQPSSFLASTDVLDTIISGEPLQVERKYHDPVTIIPHAKVCWAMNDLPRVANATSGIFRRVRVVSFPLLAENERDLDVKLHIEREGAGILNWALEGLRRLNKRGHFDMPQSVLDATAEFEASNDVPARFLEEEAIRDPHSNVSGKRLHEAYSQWCHDNDHKPRSSTHMASEWKRLGLERRRVKGRTYYHGIRLLLPSEKRDDDL
jgi:P4 family phage/plasmid primase-like protien